MFDWKLFLTLVIISIPGIFFIIPSIKIIYHEIKKNIPKNKKILSESNFIVISLIQSFIFVAITAAFGTAVSKQIDLHSAFTLSALQSELIPTLIVCQSAP